jgi:mono/diheme cytochrome c family protein
MRKVLKWAGIVIGAGLLVLVLAAAGVWVNAARHAGRSYAVAPLVPPIPHDSASLARGRHVVEAITKCASCHGDDLGGQKLVDNAVFARIYAPNLTRGTGGVGARLSDTDWVRAIRFGVGHDGKALAIMPSDEYAHLSDADLAAAIAYVKRAPPVDRGTPTRKFGPVGTALIGTGKIALFRAEISGGNPQPVSAPDPADTLGYGRYLVDAGGCKGCHGPGLSGRAIGDGPPGAVPASNLTRDGIAGTYTEAEFVRVLRTGKRPGGAALNDFMPWRYVGLMTDPELHAVWRYLQSVPARPFGQH